MHVDDVGLVDLDLGSNYRHVGNRHQRAARRILDPHHHRLALAHREIGDDAVKRRSVGGFLQHVRNSSQVGLVL